MRYYIDENANGEIFDTKTGRCLSDSEICNLLNSAPKYFVVVGSTEGSGVFFTSREDSFEFLKKACATQPLSFGCEIKKGNFSLFDSPEDLIGKIGLTEEELKYIEKVNK